MDESVGTGAEVDMCAVAGRLHLFEPPAESVDECVERGVVHAGLMGGTHQVNNGLVELRPATFLVIIVENNHETPPS